MVELSKSPSIRLLTETDLEDADLILKSAFQHEGSRAPELRMYRRLQPDGWFLALREGKPIGLVATTNYVGFAYVGMMAVHIEYQRQGIAFALMRHLLDWIDGQRIPIVLLDASDKGQPLYKKLGFQTYDQTHVMQYCGVVPTHRRIPPVENVSERDHNALAEYDLKVFGADRSRVLLALLDTFPGRAFIVRDAVGQVSGYLVVQKNRIGPWVAESRKDAEVLLQAALSLPREGDISVIVPEVNQGGMDLLTHSGFEILRTNQHMGRGGVIYPIARRKVYGLTSLALG